MTLEKLHQLFLKYPAISTDSRKVLSDSIFFALKGENFDGNVYANDALNKGAAYAIVDNARYANNERIILVADVLKNLQELSGYHRKYCKARVIGLTGSNGKTTTKELINAVLSKKYNTIATKGNLNNHIGVPLTLLTIKPDTDFAIVEMGANHQKEIEFLTAIARPDFGYITNFGKAHLEGFGGVAGVIKGKSELYDFLMENNKYIFINADDPIQLKKLGNYVKKIGFSTEKRNFFRIELKSTHPFVTISVEGTSINTQLIGSYNFTNCSAAILIGKYFNVSLANIKEALENYIPDNNRSQIIEKSGYKIILDAYNANPSSMVAALENFNQMKGGPKHIFLGDMLELGVAAEKEHQQIAEMAQGMQFDQVFLIGEHFNRTSTSLTTLGSFDALVSHLKDTSVPKGVILIKGSRGMALERILEYL